MAKVIHICPRYAPARGGAEGVMQRWSEHLAAAGHDVQVWTTDAATVRGLTTANEPRVVPVQERIGGVLVRRFWVRRWYGQRMGRTIAHRLPLGDAWHASTLRWSPWVPSLARASRHYDGRVDLVQACALPYTSLLLPAARLAQRCGARLVFTPFTHVARPGHDGDLARRAYLSPFNTRLLSLADRVVAQTACEVDALVRVGIPARRIAVIAPGVDVNQVDGGDRAAARLSWQLPADGPVIGHLGNLSQDKGTIDLLEAMPAVWQRCPSARLLLAGPTMASYRAHVARRALDPRVIELGMLSDDQRRQFFAAIDVLALPSYVESFGLVPLEAAAAGAAVVVYAHGGLTSVWSHGVDALMPAPGDITHLGAALATLCESPEDRAILSAAARMTAVRHDWVHSLARVDALYDSLLQASTR